MFVVTSPPTLLEHTSLENLIVPEWEAVPLGSRRGPNPDQIPCRTQTSHPLICDCFTTSCLLASQPHPPPSPTLLLEHCCRHTKWLEKRPCYNIGLDLMPNSPKPPDPDNMLNGAPRHRHLRHQNVSPTLSPPIKH